MTKIFHRDIKIEGEKDEAVSQKIRSRKILPRVKRQKELEMERAPSRLNTWSLYRSVIEGILVVLDVVPI